LTETKPIRDIALVDTNILIYWFDASDDKRNQKSLVIFDEVRQNPGRFAIGLQSIREFCNIMLNKKKYPKDEIELAVQSIRGLFSQILFDSAEDAQNAVGLSHDNKAPYWGCLLATTAHRHKIKYILTENTRDFSNLLFVKAINPLK